MDVFQLVLSFVLQFLPLFLIPFAFRLAGGALAQISGYLQGQGTKGSEYIKGNANDPNSLRNRKKYNVASKVNAGRVHAFDRFGDMTKGEKGRFSRRVGTMGGRMVGVGNIHAARARYNEEQEKIAAQQYGTGDDATQRAFWAKKAEKDMAMVDSDGNEVKDSQGNTVYAQRAGRYYMPYKNDDGTYNEVSALNVSKARQLAGKDMSRVQALAKYEVGKAAEDGHVDTFLQRYDEITEEMGWGQKDSGGVATGVGFAHQGARKELKHLKKDKNGNWVINHNKLSNELADSMRKGDFASFRSSTGRASLAGYRQARDRLASNTYEPGNTEVNRDLDEATVRNYQQLAQHLKPSLDGTRPMQDQAATSGDEDGATMSGGYGLGASARAEASWRAFVSEVDGDMNPRQGSGGQGSP